MTTLIATDIGGTKISCVLIDESDGIRTRAELPTGSDADSVLDAVVRLANSVDPFAEAVGIGISTCGVVDPQTGRIIGSTDRISGWLNTDLTREIERRLKLPTTSVNDVQAHAIGEFVAGAAAQAQSAVVVAIGTGLGAVLVTADGVQRGFHGAAGHLGHTYSAVASGIACGCGKQSHLESIVSGLGVPRLYGMLGGTVAGISAEEVFASSDTDAIAQQTIELAASELGKAIGSLCNLTDPELVVMSGGMRNPSAQWLGLLEQAMRSVLIPVLEGIPLREAGLGSDAALIGAAHLSREACHAAA